MSENPEHLIRKLPEPRLRPDAGDLRAIMAEFDWSDTQLAQAEKNVVHSIKVAKEAFKRRIDLRNMAFSYLDDALDPTLKPSNGEPASPEFVHVLRHKLYDAGDGLEERS